MAPEAIMSEVVVDTARDRSTPSVASKNKDKGTWATLVLAYRTLGVVMGSLVTSPLYVYPSMALDSPTEEDYLAIYSIMFWTLTLIGVVKYACIALNADDNGEGGTFALYSLLCRNMNIGILSSRPGSVSGESSENKTRLAKFLEGSLVLRRALLFIAILGMCMLIGDSILTPAISVLSAIEGIRAPFPAVTSTMVEMLSAVVLIVLFLLQRFGTSGVSFMFSPILSIWTLSIQILGIYSIIHHYPSIFKAISPHYIVQHFTRNAKATWMFFGGTILCITGSEALFADLGHFNKRSIQIAFCFALYPSLVLAYAGQTAYLIKHPNDHGDGFYKFIPKPVYWPMFVISTLAAIVASQSLISATFSVIKQSVVLDYFPRVKVVHTSATTEGEVYSPEVNYALMILCVAVLLAFGSGQAIGNAYGVVVCLVMIITTVLLTLVIITVWRAPVLLAAIYFAVFASLEGFYASAVLTKILVGGWIPFVISFILAFIMFAWFYGRQRKMQYEMTHKIDSEKVEILLSHSTVLRVPGLCFFYTKIQDGFTPIFEHYIKNMKSLHSVTIFTTFEYLLVPKVDPQKRIRVKKLGLKGLYSCVIQYGYADSLDLEQEDLVRNVTNLLQVHISSSGDPVQDTQEEVSELEEATVAGIIHVMGKTRFHVSSNSGWFERFMLAVYEALHSNCRSALPAVGLPTKQHTQVLMMYEA